MTEAEPQHPENADALLAGVRVLDLTGEPGAMAGRILGDLGATVVGVSAPDLDVEGPTADTARHLAWSAGTIPLDREHDETALAPLVDGADIVLTTPGWPGTIDADPADAPRAVWVAITPFGLDGPRAGWRAGDLGVMASSGNMYCTGDPDRAPVRCAEPTAYAHTGPEAALAALTGLASGHPQLIDLSMQETVLLADMGAPGRYAREQDRGRRRGANIGRTREIWPCTDGFVSFGIRGGKARLNTWAVIERRLADEGIDTTALHGRDWATFNHNTADNDDLAAISASLGEYFSRHTMTELYELACEHNLTLAPINSPKEILSSEQLKSRDFFGPSDGGATGQVDDEEVLPAGLPHSFVTVHSPQDRVPPVAPHVQAALSPAVPSWEPRPLRPAPAPDKAWAGTTIIEFGSGAAGPIATRFFAEHGATVIRVESPSRPDFLRSYALGPKNPHGLDGAPMFDSLNAGKLGVTLNLKHPEGRALALELIDHADAVAENFAPKAMRGLGLDYESLLERRDDLVMVSACLNGQTGPHRDYPGFGGQGAALAGFNFLTGWPDREPVGPYGTITDSLAPRFAATALAAGLLYRRRTGHGVHLDLSQVEAGIWALSPWLLRYTMQGELTERRGNRSDRAVPHGAFPCRGDDRWVAIAVWTDDEWTRLADLIGLTGELLDDTAGLADRAERIDEIEAAVASWTTGRDARAVAAQLQAAGIEAVPVQDFADCHDDPQLAHRNHFEILEHPLLGEGGYERNGFRLSACGSGYGRTSPLLGQHNEEIFGGLLGRSADELERLAADGVFD